VSLVALAPGDGSPVFDSLSDGLADVSDHSMLFTRGIKKPITITTTNPTTPGMGQDSGGSQRGGRREELRINGPGESPTENPFA